MLISGQIPLLTLYIISADCYLFWFPWYNIAFLHPLKKKIKNDLFSLKFHLPFMNWNLHFGKGIL